MRVTEVTEVKELNDYDLPMQFSISFHKAVTSWEKYATEEFKEHPFHISAKEVIKEIKKTPELIEGFSDFNLLTTHKDKIELLLKPLFPEELSSNEIKAASIPFSFKLFMLTSRFEKIMKEAGDDFIAMPRNLDADIFYIHACTMILSVCYGYDIDLRRPFFFDIPDKNGDVKNYRVAFNADMAEVFLTENAPKITEEDYHLLLDNFENIDLWREKFPPNSYVFKGFGIINLFDVTVDQIITDIRTNLLRSDDDLIFDLEKDLARFFNIKDLMLGYSSFEFNDERFKIKRSESLIFDVDSDCNSDCEGFFCNSIIENVFTKNEFMAISNVEKYGESTAHNDFYKRMKIRDINSIILIPIKSKSTNDITVLEIASPRAYELNSINKNKLKDIMPVFELAVDRSSKEHENIIEATIQEHYTTIHPSVKWRFSEAAEKYQHDLSLKKGNKVKLDEIVFQDVYPLYGQADIKGSSLARNKAVKQDLTIQLELAKNVIKEALNVEVLPIYNELMFRISTYYKNISKGLKAGDEIEILEFLKQDIYPVFNHIKTVNQDLAHIVEIYESKLDKNLHVVYGKRKNYEQSVTLLNDKLANYLDEKQKKAQEMFPHYFERYKTDGVEHNMYIGQSLVKSKKFENLYLYNLRLWQLQMMVEMENVAYRAKSEMDTKLNIASLILVHSNPLSIKFRMDEKQFDVDGAYNIRYEIIKKRIDKACINGTKERLTQPGKIAIVYSQDKDAIEYKKYIKFLQSKKLFGKLEKLELEDLQGVSGLKALRVEVIYQNTITDESSLAFEALIKEIQV